MADGYFNEFPIPFVGATAEGVAYDNTDSGLTASDVQGAIDEVLTDGLIVRRVAKTVSATVASGSYSTFPIDVGYSGYKAIGVVGFFGSGNSLFSLADLYVSNDTTVMVYFRNQTSSSQTLSSFTVDVLYKKA